MRPVRHSVQSALAFVLLLAPLGLGAQAPTAPASATLPTAPRTEDRHASFLARAAQGNVDVLWVGDSITDWWARAGIDVWNANWASLNSANFGIAGDTTNGVLWRMQNGELQGFEAKLIILMLGTNNLRSHTPADIAAGDRLIVQEFRRQQPQAKVLVLGVFPRAADPADPRREQIRELNGHLAELADGENVFFMGLRTSRVRPLPAGKAAMPSVAPGKGLPSRMICPA
jgi:hypothetical protein